MNWILPAASALLVVLVLVGEGARAREKLRIDLGRAMWLVAFALAAAAVVWRFEPAALAACGVSIAVAASMAWLVGGLGENHDRANAPVAIGLATLAASLPSAVPSFDAYVAPAQWAAVAMLGFGALITRSGTGGAAAGVAAAVVASDAMGSFSSKGVGAAHAGSVLALGVGVVAFALERPIKWPSATLRTLVVGLATAIFAYLVVEKVVHSHSGAQCALIGALAATLAHFTVEGAETDVVRRTLAAIIWLAASSVAFGLEHAFGMAITGVVGAAFAIATGSEVALAALAPTLALILARALREAHPDSTRALDLGQQYAVVGLAFGFGLPSMIANWRRNGEGGLGGVAWSLLLGAVLALAMILTGAKGGYGLMIGLGLAGLAPVGRVVSPVALSAVGGSLVLAYGWFESAFTSTRDERISLAVGPVVALALAACALAFDARLARREVA